MKKSMKKAAREHRQRQVDYTAKMDELGFKRLHIWVHLDDIETVKKYTDRKFKARRKAP